MHEFNFCPESGHLYHNNRLMQIVPPAARQAFKDAAGSHGINVMKPEDEAPKRTLVLVAQTKVQPK